MYFIIYTHIFLVIILQIIPTGDYQLNTVQIGPLYADHLVHILIFLPWMFLFCLKSGKRSGVSNSVRRSVDEPVNTKRNTVRMLEKPYLGSVSWLVWMGLGITLAILAEGIHYWAPHRNFNPMDALFNALGVLIGAIFLAMMSAVRVKSKVGSKIFKAS